ncbi:MAG: NADH-quinone oxidoreductase subunit C [bacterium]
MDLEILNSLFPDAITQTSLDRGQAVAMVKSARIHEVLRACKQDPRLQFDLLLDVVGVDFLGQRPRFEVVYILYSVPLNHRLRLKVRVEEGEPLPTASDLWASADWAEREVWDMYGVKFEGHPNLKRILLFEGFEGHPLRKDYPTERRQKIPVIEEIP